MLLFEGMRVFAIKRLRIPRSGNFTDVRRRATTRSQAEATVELCCRDIESSEEEKLPPIEKKLRNLSGFNRLPFGHQISGSVLGGASCDLIAQKYPVPSWMMQSRGWRASGCEGLEIR